MMSLVAGKTLGAVKNANPIVVRMPRLGVMGQFTKEDWLQGLMRINDDIGFQYSKQQTTAVVLLATYFPKEVFYRRRLSDGGWLRDSNNQYIDDSTGWVDEAYKLLANMEAKGALIVTGTGNSGNNVVDGWPARFGMKTSSLQISSLIVAGSVTPDGEKALHNFDPAGGVPHGMLHLCAATVRTITDHGTVYAPGDQVVVAEGDRSKWQGAGLTRGSSGSSDGRQRGAFCVSFHETYKLIIPSFGTHCWRCDILSRSREKTATLH